MLELLYYDTFFSLDYVPCIKAPYSVLAHDKLNRAQLTEWLCVQRHKYIRLYQKYFEKSGVLRLK